MKIIRNGKLNDRQVREIFEEVKHDVRDTSGKYSFANKDEVLSFIKENKGKQRMSFVLGSPFEVNEITEEHLFKKGRFLADYERRVRLFGPGLEIVEETGVLIGVDTVTDAQYGITYYEIIGLDPNIPDTIIRVKLSEINKNGKAYFTVFAISGGAPVPATSSSDRRPGRITTSDINSFIIANENKESTEFEEAAKLTK